MHDLVPAHPEDLISVLKDANMLPFLRSNMQGKKEGRDYWVKRLVRMTEEKIVLVQKRARQLVSNELRSISGGDEKL